MPLTRFKRNAHEPSAEMIPPLWNGMTRRSRNTKAPMVHELASKSDEVRSERLLKTRPD